LKKKIVGILIFVLMLCVAFSVATGQKMIKTYENQYIDILNNSPPTDPVISCPDKVKENRIFFLRAVSSDPDDDQIYYRLQIGESDKPSQWIGPYDSGVEYATGVGIFKFTGNITIGLQAKDKYDAESGWSYHTLTITKMKSIFISNLNILEQISLRFPLLTRLLQPVFNRLLDIS
jgi:hypothetical protein